MYVPPHKRSGDFTGPAVRKFLKDSYKNRCLVQILDDLSMFSAFDDDSQEQLIEKKKSLLEKRHDILHCYACDILELDLHLGTGNPIGNIFPDLPADQKLKTPDIVEVLNTSKCIHVNIYDPQITINVKEGYEQKKLKYNPLLIEIQKLGHTCTIFPMIHSPNGNLNDAFLELSDKPTAFHLETYSVAMEDVTKSIFHLTQLIRCNLDEGQSIFDRDFPRHGTFDETINNTPEGKFSYRYFSDKHIYNPIADIHELASDPEVIEILRDKKTNRDLFDHHFESIIEDPNLASIKYKPTFHIAYCDPMDIPGAKYSEFRVDQQNTLRFLDYIYDKDIKLVDPKIQLLIKIRKDLMLCLESTGDKNLFLNKTYTGDSAKDEVIQEKFIKKQGKERTHEHASRNDEHHQKSTDNSKTLKGVSVRGVFKQWDSSTGHPTLNLREERPYISRSRSLLLSGQLCNDKFYMKSGHKFKNTHKEGRQYKSDLNCPMEGASHFQRFYDFVSYPTLDPLEIDPLYLIGAGSDSELALKIKTEARKEFATYLTFISRTRAYQMAYHTHLICKQLIHYNNINTKDGSVFFLNSGLPNVLHIMLGGTCQRSKDIGRPYFTAYITENTDWITPVFGEFTTYPIGRKKVLIITGWRRLDTKKLMSVCDNFHSCISTGFDTYMRQLEVDMGNPLITDQLKFIYVYRALVGLNTSQRCAELLMDVRYLAMSFCSIYSDVATLIKDKFGPTYPNCFSRWIVSRLAQQSSQISAEFNKPENFLKRKAGFTSEGSRDIRTTGGEISLPSLWTDHRIHCLQDLFDELFVYVHTMKDPASVYYESVKSLNTILKYQEEYDKLNTNSKNGVHNVASFKKMILSGCQVGCWADVIAYSSRISASNLAKIDCTLGINSQVLKEPLSSVESTKAVIPEYDRKGPPLEKKKQGTKNVEGETEKAKKIEDTALKNLRSHLERMGMEVLDRHNYQRLTLSGVIKESPILENTATGRHKVHDAILDHLIRHPTHSNTFDVSKWNLLENSGRVTAHFCIKSQYGPKREFYVVNFGAKCMVRSYESIYKVIAQMLPEEMISEPGDKKLMFMEQLSNEATKCGRQQHIYFCNGDCTKWSACETMPSFMALAHGLRELTGEGAYEYTMAVLSCWANKNIRIPDEMLEGMKYITNRSTYLKDGPERHSTQNFLQGMFNYSSSVKAVFATRLAYIAYNDKYPNTITLQHLEHSDDYVLVIKADDTESLETFRIYHKLVQKMHGINDSTKKTNVQEYIMEFISLMSFNGYMAYPNIKKTKEVGLNVAAEGYQRDIMNAVSRSSESVRLGVPLKVAYIQQLIQSVNIYRAYSLVERNSPNHIHSPFDYPTGLFGMPDCLPIAYVNNNADMNNLRIYKYAPPDCVELLKGLYEMSLSVQEDTYDNGTNLPTCLHTPQYSLPKSGTKIKVIQSKIGMTFEKSEKYRKDHPEYLIMKPRHPKLYREWLEYMYFNSSFAKAYTRVSRANLLLHISHIVSAPCIRTDRGVPKIKLVEYIEKIFNQCRSLARKKTTAEGNLMHALTNSNAASQLYTRMMENTAIERRPGACFNTVATQLPSTSFENRLVNGLDTIMQRMVSPERANMDERRISNQRYWDSDIEEIEKLGCEINDLSIVQVFKNMKSGQPLGRKYGMALNISSNSGFENYLTCYLENNISYGYKYFARSIVDTAPVVNYSTGESVMTLRFNKQKNITTVILDNMCQLYYYYNICEGLTPADCMAELEEWSHNGTGVLDVMSNISEQELGNRAYDIRMLAFFKTLMTGLWLPIENLLKHKLFYTKCYFDSGTDFSKAKSIGVTYMGHQSIFTIVKDSVYMISKKLNLSVLKNLYLVGLHAYRKITTQQLQDLMCGRKIYNITLRKGMPGLFKNVHRARLSKVGRVIRMDDDATEINFFPFYFTNKPFLFKLGKKEKFEANFKISETEPTVLMGSQKVMGLPLLSTNDMFVLKPGKKTTPKGISTRVLSENALLSHYLTGQQHNEELSLGCVEGLSNRGKASFTSHSNFPNANSIRDNLPWLRQMDNLAEHKDPDTYIPKSRKIHPPKGKQDMCSMPQYFDEDLNIEDLRELAEELDPGEGYGGILGNRLDKRDLKIQGTKKIQVIHTDDQLPSSKLKDANTSVSEGNVVPVEPNAADLPPEAFEILKLASLNGVEAVDMVNLILEDDDGDYGMEYEQAAIALQQFDEKHKKWEEYTKERNLAVNKEDCKIEVTESPKAIPVKPEAEQLPKEAFEILALAQEMGVTAEEMVDLIMSDDCGDYGDEYMHAAVELTKFDAMYKEWEKLSKNEGVDHESLEDVPVKDSEHAEHIDLVKEHARNVGVPLDELVNVLTEGNGDFPEDLVQGALAIKSQGLQTSPITNGEPEISQITAEIEIVLADVDMVQEEEFEQFPETSSSEEPEIDPFYFDTDSEDEEENIVIDDVPITRRERYFSVVNTIRDAPPILEYVESCWEGRTIALLVTNPSRMFTLLKVCILAEGILGSLTSSNYESSCIRALRDTMYKRMVGHNIAVTSLEVTGKFKGRHETGIMYNFQNNGIKLMRFMDVTGLEYEGTVAIDGRTLVVDNLTEAKEIEALTTINEPLDWLPQNSFWCSIKDFYKKICKTRDNSQVRTDIKDWLKC